MLLFDSNIILHYIRETPVKDFVETRIKPFFPGNEIVLSVVSIGELRSIAIKNQWGAKRRIALEGILEEFIIVDINSEDVFDRYAEIDAFSQDKLPEKPLGNSARNMGKNDLWIAATASVLEAKLLTTDADFDHLASVFLDLERVVLA